MSVAPGRGDVIGSLFGKVPAIIGVVHCPPLPGSPRYRGEPIPVLAEQVLADARAYVDGGVDGLIVENHGDIPFLRPDDIGPETAAVMAVLGERVRRETGVVIGINVLANAASHALAVAVASGAAFIRVNQWANAYVANEGLLSGDAGRALRYRAALKAEHIRVFADAHVKHGAHAIVADRPVVEQARDVAFFDADAIIATGQRTGDAATADEIVTLRQAGLPLLVGSGVTIANLPMILPLVDGIIVASSLKSGGLWWNPVEPARVERFMALVRSLRAEA